MKRLFPTLIVLFGTGGLALTQEAPPVPPPDPVPAYRDAAASIDEDLRKALDELAKLRALIATEKPMIAGEANRIAADLREKRRQSELARTSKDAAESEFEKAGNDLKVWRDEQAYIESLFLDLQKTREVTAGPVPLPGFAAPATGDLTGKLDLIDRVIGELKSTGSVIVAKGEAVAPGGILTPGTFAKAGPVSWFLSEDSREAGLVEDGPDLRPRVVPGGMDATSISRVIKGEPTPITFDPTLGSATALKASETSFLVHIEQGGFWMIPIFLLAGIALAAALYKWAQLSRIRDFGSGPVQQILDAINQGHLNEASAEAAKLHHPARGILDRGILFMRQNLKTSRDDLEEALYEEFLAATPALQRGLPLIAITSATAPLLGLLGTVTGMIETFRLLNVFGTGDAKSLASGISEALITTEYGLIVAIPALILHALLSRRVEGIKSVMEMTSLAFLNSIKTP